MAWEGTEEQNRLLYAALGELVMKKGELARLAGALSKDERTLEADRRRRGDDHQDGKKKLIDATTLARWHDEGLPRLMNAHSHKKGLVFEFLERSPYFKTCLYRPEGALPKGLLAFAAEHAALLAQPFVKDLRKLDGAFEVFRPAWTTPERRDRILITRMQFTTESGFTRFREEQDYLDPEYHDEPIREIDEGAVMFTAANLILLSFGMNAERVKLYIADTWQDALNGPLPVIRFSGSMIGIAGRKYHPKFPFVAMRSKKSFARIETGVVPASHARIDPKIREYLTRPEGAF
ncbi:MAG: hypothetical protein HXY22_07780 [Alphaproteobacteria bacterium]|nr:hypothetical protein [Alphaproteobacteria bacterium]